MAPNSPFLFGHYFYFSLGPESALVSGVKLIASAIKTKKIIFKGHITTNSNLPTKFLYVVEILIQNVGWGSAKKLATA
jgi:hypothetical protein